MTRKEQSLAALLILFMVGFAILVVGYLFVYEPMTDYQRQTRELTSKNLEAQAKLAQIRKELPRLQTEIRRSLPQEAGVAQEYDAILNKLLLESKIPLGSYTIAPKPVELKSNVELPNKRPAFNRIGMEITLKKVKQTQLIEFLRRYYQLNLLQQISKLTVKKTDDKTPEPERGAPTSDRADLDVTILTEAIQLDGAEPRKSLLAIPVAYGLVGGGSGWQTLAQTPKPARGINPLTLVEVLATADRNYDLMLVKDIYHGMPPPPEPPEPVVVKEDTSEFIRLTAIANQRDGTGIAYIEDLASKQEYVVELKANSSGKITPNVAKYYYTPKGARKSFDVEPTLDISESSSRTDRKFRVVSFWDSGLVVAEKASATPSTSPGGTGASGGNRARSTVGSASASAGRTSLATPLAALGGGAASGVTPPAERFFLWRAGQSLANLTELRGNQLEQILKPLSLPTSNVPNVPTASSPQATSGK
jgi:hypothetical protein